MPSPPQRRLLPTTRTQVSGHRFMRRRVEHGLIFGDIRMIHDPLASRQRATVFGAVAVALVAAIMALFAWLRPNADPGAAPILRAGSGELYVRVGETVHPVTNLTSARLIVGAPEQPARIGDAKLGELPLGVPVGVVTAPSAFAPREATDASWSACTAAGEVVVLAGQPAVELDGNAALLAFQGGDEWLVTGDGRALLPAADSPEGRIIRRALGIDADTPRWLPPADVLGVVREQPPLSIPDPLPEVVVNGTEAWAVSEPGVQPLSRVQREILFEAGAPQRSISSAELAAIPDADPALDIRLPTETPGWVNPADTTVCATEDRVGATLRGGAESPVALSGNAAATAFAGLVDGAVGVDTGHGYHVVSPTGLRHPVREREVLDVIGAQHVEHAPWEIIRLLPEGPELTRDAAMTATY